MEANNVDTFEVERKEYPTESKSHKILVGSLNTGSLWQVKRLQERTRVLILGFGF